MVSHAQLPTPMVLGEGLVRVFFASRDARQYSSIAFVDVQIGSEDVEVVSVSRLPVLSPGPIGYFDEHGVFPSCVVRDRGKWLMYFIGWNKGYEAPLFYASIGLAESDDGENFQRIGVAPMLARSTHDPCLVTSPHVIDLGNRWLMTYVSGIGWHRDAQGRLQSRYHIKLARGNSPREFVREGQVAIDLADGETNVARSSVISLRAGLLGMWFSYVHSSIGKYRLGYAESTDGIHWSRNDSNAGVSDTPDFASEMMCYPAVFEVSGSRYLLVNGNGFGAQGFGIAVWRGGQ